jgi:acetolactate synthase-1/2/3 large subunit
MKASDLFVRCLEAEGIEYVFGVPGEENADLMLSLADSGVRFVLTRHEQGAAFMAEVYGRLTGNPAGCLGTLGPGATNLITGVADGNMDRAPMLVLTGQAGFERQHKESHQVMDVVALFRPVTKWTQTIHRPENIPEVLRKAVRLARTEKPGACHVELAEDVAKLETSGEPIPPRRFRRPVPDDAIVDRAWDTIRRARRPIIVAGNGTIRKRASRQLRAFVEKTGIGVVSTFMAKGCVDADAETCCYTIGLQARDFPAIAVEQSDLVITIGYDMVEYPPRLWNPDGRRRIVHLDFIPAEIDGQYRPEVELVGDLAHSLWMLNERADALGPGALQYDHSHTRAARAALREDLEEWKDDDATGRIKPQKAIWEARRVLGPSDLLLSDVGAHKMWIARYYPCHEPNTCLIPNGFCAMGFALPGAIAAKLALPDRRVLAICGDGGFLMNAQEMETARRLDSDVVVLVWEDGGYGLIEWKQQDEFSRHTDLAFGNPDFTRLAQAFGWNGFRCEDSAELGRTLEQAFEAPGPSLVSIPIDYRENPKLSQRLGEIECAL